jgi:hypothetical protein
MENANPTIPTGFLAVHIFCLRYRGENGVIGNPEEQGMICRQLPCFTGCLGLRDNGGRRATLNQEEYYAEEHDRERRLGLDRRDLLDRRDVLDRRIEAFTRSTAETSDGKNSREFIERRSGSDRRSRIDRRDNFLCLFSRIPPAD